MFAHPLYYHKHDSVSPRFNLAKRMNQGTLAMLMFIAYAGLAIIGGRESGPQKPVSAYNQADTNLAVGHDRSGACLAPAAAVQSKQSFLLNSWQSAGSMVGRLKGSFSEPSVVDYANQQGIGIPYSAAPPLIKSADASVRRQTTSMAASPSQN